MPVCRSLLDYWISLSVDGALPRKADLQPRDIDKLLPNLFILGKEAGGILRIRLLGTGLSEGRGEDLTGAEALDLYPRSQRSMYADLFTAVLNLPCGCLLGRRNDSEQYRSIRFLSIILPMAGDNGETEFLVGATERLNRIPGFRPRDEEPLRGARVTRSRFIDLGWGLPDPPLTPFQVNPQDPD